MPNPEFTNTGADTGESIGETIDRKTAEARGERTLEATKAELEARRKKAEEYDRMHEEIQAKIAAQKEKNESLMAELKALRGEGPTSKEKLTTREKSKNHRGFKHLVSAMLTLVVLAGCNGGAKSKAEDEVVLPPPNPIVETATTSTTPNDLGLIWEDEAENPDESEDEFAGPEDIVYEAVDEEASAPVETTELGNIPAVEFMPNGVVGTKNGELQKFIYQGGYREENDPYSAKFAHQGEKVYENDTAYGLAIEGVTEIEKTENWLKRVVASPEAIVRLRVQLGLERLQSIEEENARANEIRNMSAEDYDQIANDTINTFYSRIQSGSIKQSTGWVLENFMNDEASGNHENAAVHGRLNGDDDKDTLLTFYDKDGNNIVSSMRGFSNTRQDANTTRKDIDSEAWVNMDEGGSWKWKEGAVATSVVNRFSGSGTPSTPKPNPSKPTTSPAPKNNANASRIDTNINQSLPTSPVKPNTSGQQRANENAIPVSQAPTSGQALQDGLADLGIN